MILRKQLQAIHRPCGDLDEPCVYWHPDGKGSACLHARFIMKTVP